MDCGTVLVRNVQRALGMRKRAAAEGRVFSADATTPSAWLQEMWSLCGDARRLRGAHERTLLKIRALRQAAPEDEGILSVTPGTAKLLGAFVFWYAGVPAFDALLEDAKTDLEAFPPGEAAALRAVGISSSAALPGSSKQGALRLSSQASCLHPPCRCRQSSRCSPHRPSRHCWKPAERCSRKRCACSLWLMASRRGSFSRLAPR